MSNLQPLEIPTTVNPSWKIGIVAAQWHRDILQPMIDVAVHTLEHAGIPREHIAVHDAPGSFEVPLIGASLIPHVDALIGFGIVLQGETMHAQNIMQSASQAIMDLQLTHQKPFAFEILHVLTLAQARARSEGPHNKGFEAARAILCSLVELEKIHTSHS